jgi:hypothetical protein
MMTDTEFWPTDRQMAELAGAGDISDLPVMDARPEPGRWSVHLDAARERAVLPALHRDTMKLLKLWPGESTRQMRTDQIIARLTAAARAERSMGLARHWAYDPTRHAALIRTLKQWRDAHADVSDAGAEGAVAGRAVRACGDAQ